MQGASILHGCCRILVVAALVLAGHPTLAAADGAADAEFERLRSLLGSLTGDGEGVPLPAPAPAPPTTTRLRVLVTTPDSETHSLAIVSRPGWSVNDLTAATAAKLGKKLGGGGTPHVHSLTCDGDWMDPADLVDDLQLDDCDKLGGHASFGPMPSDRMGAVSSKGGSTKGGAEIEGGFIFFMQTGGGNELCA